MWAFGFWLGGVKNVSLGNITLIDPPSFGFLISNASNLVGANLTKTLVNWKVSGAYNDDAFHFWGPLTNVWVNGLKAVGCDNQLAFNFAENASAMAGISVHDGLAYGVFGSAGDVLNVSFANVDLTANSVTAAAQVLFFGSSTCQATNVSINGLRLTAATLPWFQDYGGHTTINSLSICNVTGTCVSPYPAGTVGTVSGSTFVPAAGYYPAHAVASSGTMLLQGQTPTYTWDGTTFTLSGFTGSITPGSAWTANVPASRASETCAIALGYGDTIAQLTLENITVTKPTSAIEIPFLGITGTVAAQTVTMSNCQWNTAWALVYCGSGESINTLLTDSGIYTNVSLFTGTTLNAISAWAPEASYTDPGPTNVRYGTNYTFAGVQEYGSLVTTIASSVATAFQVHFGQFSPGSTPNPASILIRSCNRNGIVPTNCYWSGSGWVPLSSAATVAGLNDPSGSGPNGTNGPDALGGWWADIPTGAQPGDEYEYFCTRLLREPAWPR